MSESIGEVVVRTLAMRVEELEGEAEEYRASIARLRDENDRLSEKIGGMLARRDERAEAAKPKRGRKPKAQATTEPAAATKANGQQTELGPAVGEA